MKTLGILFVTLALIAWGAPPVYADDIFDPGEGYTESGDESDDGSEQGATEDGTDKNKDNDTTDNDNGIGNSRNVGVNVPYITNDDSSVQFLVNAIVESLAEALGLNGGDAQEVGQSAEANYYKYARNLSETLSQLTPAEQNTIWHGY